MRKIPQEKVLIHRKCISVLKQSPLTSFLITIALVLPLSVSMLASSYTFTHLLTLTDLPEHAFQASCHQWFLFIVVELLCSLYLFFVTTSCLLCAVFMIKFVSASVNTSNPVSFSSINSTTTSAITSSSLFDGFTLSLDITLAICLIPVTTIAYYTSHHLSPRLLCTLSIQFFVLLVLLCIRMLNRGNLARIFKLIREHIIPNCGAIICKSCDCEHTVKFCVILLLLFGFVTGYMLIYMMINGVFATIVVLYPKAYSMFTRIITSVLLVGALSILNWITLLVISVRTYDITESVNKQEKIDKTNVEDDESVPHEAVKMNNIMKTNDLHVSNKANQMLDEV